MNDQRKLLLLSAAKNGGRISVRDAERLYSSKSSAQSALASLRYKGFLSLAEAPGYFELEKLPREVRERYEEWKEEQDNG